MNTSGILTLEEIKGFPRSHRFLVFAETAPGAWVNVYKGQNEKESVRIANFWDERVNVEYIDVVQEKYQAEAAIQAEKERRSRLPISEQLELSLKEQIASIDANCEKAIQRLNS